MTKKKPKEETYDGLNHQAVRFLILLSLVCSPVIAIVGSTQKGKSTFLYWLANEICKVKYDLGLWKERKWNYKKYCCRSFMQFKKVVRDTNNNFIAIEEAGTQISSDTYWDLENRLFGRITMTQAYKRNLYAIIVPATRDVAKRHRGSIDIIFSIEKKRVGLRMVTIKPNFIKKMHWLLKDRNFKQIWLNKMYVFYSEDFIKRSTVFTDWLEKFKEEIMDDIDNEYEKAVDKGKVRLSKVTM